jgi:hypothetical protein
MQKQKNFQKKFLFLIEKGQNQKQFKKLMFAQGIRSFLEKAQKSLTFRILLFFLKQEENDNKNIEINEH